MREICARHGVSKLELFGSAAKGEFDPANSDLDFLVEFVPSPPGGHADAFFGMIDDLKELFGVEVDLVSTRAITNPYFLENISHDRTTVYEAGDQEAPL